MRAAPSRAAALASLPLWVDFWLLPDDPDGRAVMQRLTSWSRYVPVAWLRPWINAFETNWPIFVGLLVLALGFSWLGGRLQGKGDVLTRVQADACARDRTAKGPLCLHQGLWPGCRSNVMDSNRGAGWADRLQP